MKSSNCKKTKNGNYFNYVFIFFCFFVVLISAIPLIVLSLYEDKNTSDSSKYYVEQEVKIELSKDVYNYDESISFDVVNVGEENIYLQPCEEIGVFEKKVGDDWVLLEKDPVVETDYEGFDRKSVNVNCSVDLPETEGGIYRMVVPVFFGCQKADPLACKSSKNIYSESFQVLADLGDKEICEDSLLKNCDNSLVSLLGSLELDDGEYYFEDSSVVPERILLKINDIEEIDMEFLEGSFCYVEGRYHVDNYEQENSYLEVFEIEIAVTDI